LKEATAQRFWRRPLDADTINLPQGELHVLENQCKGCGFCVEFCPNEVLVLAKRFNAKGYHPPEVVKPEACVACELCQLLCHDFAIFVTVKS
jgi:2-oxoglutarate ferredoxin oxidoreductase subunit delta